MPEYYFFCNQPLTALANAGLERNSMNNFYQQSPEQQTQHLEQLVRAALPQWGLPESAAIDVLNYRENAVFSVGCNGERYALRIHRADYHSDNALRSELEWMAELNRSGIKTPDVIPASDGELFKVVSVEGVPEPRQVDILGWVDGKALGSIEEGSSSDDETAVANYRIVGELMAKLHSQAQHWDKPENFTRHAWDIDGLLGESPLWGRFWELEALTDNQRELIQRARSKARQELESFGQGDDRYGLIHGDFLPENLLRCDNGIRLIDFDDAGFGWHLFDIATSLFFLADEAFFDEVVMAFIEGYRSQRELPDCHLEKLSAFFLIRGLTYLGWAHTRKETETAKEMTPLIIEKMTAAAAEYLGE